MNDMTTELSTSEISTCKVNQFVSSENPKTVIDYLIDEFKVLDKGVNDSLSCKVSVASLATRIFG